jgi:hypothetical protein
MIPGETLGNGAPQVCPDCKVKLVPKVLHTWAYYIGTQCDCGPYSRESEYFKLREDAQKVLDGMIYGRTEKAVDLSDTHNMSKMPPRIGGKDLE